MSYFNRKFILSIFFLRHTAERYQQLQEQEVNRYVTSDASGEIRRKIKQNLLHGGDYPIPQFYNDMAGVAELYWDKGTRILGKFYGRADGRTTFGKKVCRANPVISLKRAKFHLMIDDGELGAFCPHWASSDEKRKALFQAVDEVEEMAKEWKVYCDTSNAREFIRCLDMEKLIPTRNKI